LRTILRFALSIVFAAMIISAAYAQPPPTLLWSDPVSTLDIAVSGNGQYVAVIAPTSGGQVRFYGRSSPTPLWTDAIPGVRSVAISADGNHVAVGGSGFVYFWANAKSLTGNANPPTWTSESLASLLILRRCIAISDDGNYVAACGNLNLGASVFYWAGAAGKSGSNVATTWDYLFPSEVLSIVTAMAISDDGNHVAAVGFLSNVGTEGVVAYLNNARSLLGHAQQPTWSGQESGELFVDVAMSDDGNYVAVAGAGAVLSTVYYWAGATSRTGTSEPHTWAGGVNVRFTSVDMSCDGDSVIAGTGFLITDAGAGGLVTAGAAAPPTGGVYFWSGARSLTGNPSPSWVKSTGASVGDVAINDAGTYMAAVDLSIPDTVYFFDRQGNLLWQDTTISGDKLSISCDGGTLAVGAPSSSPVTAHLFDTGFSTPCCGVEPVGGVLTSRNTQFILAPYVAALGFAAATIVAIAAFVKRREKGRPA
jgi:hypothetical protein